VHVKRERAGVDRRILDVGAEMAGAVVKRLSEAGVVG
jgi:hypothetical protein